MCPRQMKNGSITERYVHQKRNIRQPYHISRGARNADFIFEFDHELFFFYFLFLQFETITIFIET